MPEQAVVLDKARKITGNVPDNAVGETYIPTDAITFALAPVIRDLNTIYGTTGLKEATFTATPGVQDYPIATTIGSDVFELTEVLRSGAYLPDNALVGDETSPQTGLATARSAVIPVGYQGDALEAIIGTWRKRLHDEHDWEVVNGTNLRLMPVPQTAEVVSVRYVVSSYTIETLPANTETVLVFAACVAILNAILNRINSDRQSVDSFGQAKTERLRVLQSQRDYYQKAYEKEFARLAG